jgi:hypothetical protein
MADGFALSDGLALTRFTLLNFAVQQLQTNLQQEIGDLCKFVERCLCEVEAQLLWFSHEVLARTIVWICAINSIKRPKMKQSMHTELNAYEMCLQTT